MSSPGWGISWPEQGQEQGQATVPTAAAPAATMETSGELNTADL
jgi:hypothetical protein